MFTETELSQLTKRFDRLYEMTETMLEKPEDKEKSLMEWCLKILEYK